MKFLHTSDWHLGKLFHEKSLIEDQAFVLNQILRIAEDAKKNGTPYAALVISGDVYDRAMPPAEATTLLNSFLVDCTTALPEMHIFLNAGNHDSATRLSFAAEFLERHRIHIATNTKHITTPVIVSQGAEQVAFYQLPFLTPLSIQSDDSDILYRTQQDLYAAACKKIAESHKKNYGDMPSVINAHLFASGSTVGTSERTNVGTVEQVSVAVFKDFTYGAFGHIHKYQPCDAEKRCFYSGSLLAYNFDDSPETGMLEVEITTASAFPRVKRLLFTPLHPIATVTATMQDLIGSFADKKCIEKNKNNYVQVVLTDDVMPTEAFAHLKTVFPYLLSVIIQKQSQQYAASSLQRRKEAMQSRAPDTIFTQFITDIYGESIDDALFQKQKAIFIAESAQLASETV